MRHDTFNPLRILEAVKSFIVGLGKRGEVVVPPVAPPPATDWKETLPDDIKADPIFEKYKDSGEAHRALVSAQKFLGREKLPVPSGPEDKDTYDLIFKTLGLPENENGYELPTDFKIPDDLPVSDEMLAGFKKAAHENGILPQQFQGLYKWYMNSMAAEYKKMQEGQIASTKEAETNLRKKWGAAYNENVALAKKVFASFADEKAYAEFEKGAGNNPVYLEFFANLGKVLSEDQLQGKPSGLEMTPDEAQSEINKIKGDTNHPYWKEGHPAHAEAVERMSQLTKMTMVGQ